jgi:hypothetical protein
MEGCGKTVGTVIEDRVGKSSDVSNPYTLRSKHGIKLCGTQLKGHGAL